MDDWTVAPAASLCASLHCHSHGRYSIKVMPKESRTKVTASAAERGASSLGYSKELPFAIQPALSLPDRVAEILREMILSGRWAPGERVVETRIARQLKVGQPTVREALGKLEEAGMVRRFPNSGCVVTELSAQEVSQMFTVRIELEALAAASAAVNRNPQTKELLNGALLRLHHAATKRSIEDYYGADFALHRTIWQLADNPYLEKLLVQLVIPLFNFAILELKKHRDMDLKEDAALHGRLVKAILSGDPERARSTVKTVLKDFWHKGLTFVQDRT